MNTLVRTIIDRKMPTILTEEDLKTVEPDESLRHRQIREAVSDGDLFTIGPEFYALDKKHRDLVAGAIDGCLLAHMMVPDSYISFECALWDAGWIPEFPFIIESAFLQPPLRFSIQNTVFSYVKVPQYDLFRGTFRADCDCGGRYFIEAEPLKALADYVFRCGWNWTTIEPLVDHLRIDKDTLEAVSPADFDAVQGNYKCVRTENFLAGVRKELRV
jgi:hypothetical protein